MTDQKVYLSASRIKTAQQCSWTYWCKYILKLPDKSNDGASKGWVCHLIFEVLGRKDRKCLFDEIIKNGTIWKSPAIARLAKHHIRRLNIDTKEHIDEVDMMVLKGLKYDFFGRDKNGLKKEFSEKDFKINCLLKISYS